MMNICKNLALALGVLVAAMTAGSSPAGVAAANPLHLLSSSSSRNHTERKHHHRCHDRHGRHQLKHERTRLEHRSFIRKRLQKDKTHTATTSNSSASTSTSASTSSLLDKLLIKTSIKGQQRRIQLGEELFQAAFRQSNDAYVYCMCVCVRGFVLFRIFTIQYDGTERLLSHFFFLNYY